MIGLQFMLSLIIVITLVHGAYSFSRPKCAITPRKLSMMSIEVESMLQSASSAGLSTQLLAAEGGSSTFVYPLVISALTMIPFLYYQQ